MHEFDYGSNWTQPTGVCSSISVAIFDFVYILASSWKYVVNLTLFEPEWPRPMIHCMKHHLVDFYKFCTQDA